MNLGSVLPLVPPVLAALAAVLILEYRTSNRTNPQPQDRRLNVLAESGEPIAEDTVAGAWPHWNGPVHVQVYKAGLAVERRGHSRSAILAAEIGRLRWYKRLLFVGLALHHGAAGIPSPILLRIKRNSRIAAAIVQITNEPNPSTSSQGEMT